jgi:hypothetical protein
MTQSAPAATAQPVKTTTTTYTTTAPAGAAPMPHANLGNSLGRDPAQVLCPYCNVRGITRPKSIIDGITILIVVIVLL